VVAPPLLSQSPPIDQVHDRCIYIKHSNSIVHSSKANGGEEVKVQELLTVIRDIYPYEDWNESSALDLVREAYRSADVNYGIREAIEWGSDFTWTPDIGTRDSILAEKCKYNLTDMVLSTRQKSRGQRLSVERVETFMTDRDEDYQRMMSLTGGLQVLVDPVFRPNLTPPPKRNLYLKVKNAVNKVLQQLWQPSSCAKQLGPLHYTSKHWTTKKGKKSGRYLFDATDNKHGCALNSDAACELLRARYGEIEHPTINKLAQMVLQFIERMLAERGSLFRLEDVILWKADLSKAFTLLDFLADQCYLLASELTDDLTLIYHTGMFGWTGLPFGFQVVTRVLTKETQKLVRGQVSMFVDDMMGVTMKEWLVHDQLMFRTVAEGLLGPAAIAEDKWESGRRCEWIGWTIDLDTSLVTISQKNFLRTLYGFFNCDVDAPLPVVEIERMASWAARYSTVLRQMRPFTCLLNAEINGLRQRHTSKRLSPQGRQIVLLWRCVLCLLRLNETRYARQLCSFKELPATILICYDASLSGIGVSVHSLHDGATSIIAVGRYDFHFDITGNPRYQNIAEFIAVIAGFLALFNRGYSHVNIQLQGDSISSLTWSSTERFRGSLSNRATMVYILLAIHFNYVVVDTQHVAGVDNTLHDQLSRGYDPIDLGFKHGDIIDFNTEEYAAVIEICNPTISNYDINQHWKDIMILIHNLHR